MKIIGELYEISTKGDANNTNDSKKVYENEVEGIYFFRIPIVGQIAMFIRAPIGIMLSVMVLLLIFFIWQFAKIKKANSIIKKRMLEEREYIEELRKGEI